MAILHWYRIAKKIHLTALANIDEGKMSNSSLSLANSGQMETELESGQVSVFRDGCSCSLLPYVIMST